MANVAPVQDFASYRRRCIACVIVIGVGLALLIVVLAAGRKDAGLNVRWTFRQWHFGPYQTRQVISAGSFSGRGLPVNYALVTNGYRIGPLTVFTRDTEPELQPVSTNMILAGDILYEPNTRRKLGRVIISEDLVLVQWNDKRAEQWLARTNLQNLVFSRDWRKR